MNDLVDDWLFEEAREPNTRARPAPFALGELVRAIRCHHAAGLGERGSRHYGFSFARELERWQHTDRRGLAR